MSSSAMCFMVFKKKASDTGVPDACGLLGLHYLVIMNLRMTVSPLLRVSCMV